MEEVYRKFKYVEATDFNDLTSQWTEALGVTLHEFEKRDGFYVEVPPIKIILENIRKNKQPILTDCRFFTMLMGFLKNNPDKKKLIFNVENNKSIRNNGSQRLFIFDFKS